MTLNSLRLRLQSPSLGFLSGAGTGWGAGVREFFAYHGVLAPGVKALRVLSVRAKVLLVMVIVAAPVVPLAWQVVTSQNHAVTRATSQLAGMRLAAAASALRVELGAASTAAESGQPLPPDGRAAADARLAAAYAEAQAAGLPLQLVWERGRGTVERALQGPRVVTPTASELNGQALLALQELRDSAVRLADVQVTADKDLQRATRLGLDELPALQVALTLMRRTVHSTVAGADPHELLLRQATAAANVNRLAHDVRLHLPPMPPGAAAPLPEVAAYMALVKQQVLAKDANPDVGALRGAYSRARTEVHTLRLAQLDEAEQRLIASVERAQSVRQWVFGALLVSLGLALYLTYCFFLVMRGGLVQLDLQMRRLADGDLSARLAPLGVDEVARTMQSMTTALVRLSDLLASVRQGVGAVKQASEQVAMGNKDLTGRNRDTAQGVASVLDGVQRNAEQLAACGRQVEAVVGLVQALRLESARNRKQMQRLRERMSSLRGKSHEIGEIVTLIDNIAFRTNILALNASVEASKAGEVGRGFAVVALEVRGLAQRGADAARRIGDIVARSTDDIELSGALAEETGRALAQADAHVDQIHAAMDDVAGLTRHGEAESGQILEQLTRIKDDTAQNLRQVEQLATASDSLRSQGERLAHKVGQFKLS